MSDTAKYLQFWKPLLDKTTAIVLLVVLFPVWVGISMVLIISRRPVIFRHLRPGYKGRSFFLWKFTSMREGRMTFFGSFMRKSSLDELPQLVNIIRGDMSFIGPRPLLMEYMAEYSSDEKRRHDVKPGLTGLAQINGRNALSLKKKIELDLLYVDRVTWLLDLKILMKTVVRIFNFSQADYHSLELHKHL